MCAVSSLDSAVKICKNKQAGLGSGEDLCSVRSVDFYLRELLLCDDRPNVSCEVCRYETPKLIWNVSAFNNISDVTSTFLFISDVVNKFPLRA